MIRAQLTVVRWPASRFVTACGLACVIVSRSELGRGGKKSEKSGNNLFASVSLLACRDPMARARGRIYPGPHSPERYPREKAVCTVGRRLTGRDRLRREEDYSEGNHL